MEAKTSHPATIFRLLATVLVAAFLFGSLPAGRSAAEPAIEPTLSPTGTVAPAVTPPDKLYFPLVFNKYDPKSSLVIRKYPAFDTCHLPSLATMLTWWNKSPYWTFNLYLGGVAFSSGCNFSGLSEEWLDAVDGQGWTFILTWVGLQAPCMPGDHKMSADTGTAYQQGREEAGAAYARAQSLGFYGDLMLTADIESYARYQTTACREAVKSYVSGWVSQLHELGAKAAAYGSPCSSYVRDWATIPNVPDQVWIAEWIKNPYYNPSVSVYGSLCLADNLWDNHQRLRQYAGDHNETWGNATLNIDSDAVDGTVQTFRDGGLREYPTASAMMVKTLGVEMQDVQLVAPRIGWALAGGRLQWTDDDGAAWKDITPVDAPGALMGAFFANAQHGWLAAQSSSGDAL
ncbi:MAG: DUF1906 domain-containing protein, partial [Chloroflexi bacterium]|nr:DUF1906 domain-containing protein [Chloroflexota bacterium]